MGKFKKYSQSMMINDLFDAMMHNARVLEEAHEDFTRRSDNLLSGQEQLFDKAIMEIIEVEKLKKINKSQINTIVKLKKINKRLRKKISSKEKKTLKEWQEIPDPGIHNKIKEYFNMKTELEAVEMSMHYFVESTPVMAIANALSLKAKLEERVFKLEQELKKEIK